MEKNFSDKDLSAWVDEQMTSLVDTPVPQVDIRYAIDRFRRTESRAKGQRRARTWAVASILVASSVLLMLPSTRSLAQRLWNRVFLTGGTLVVRTPQFEPPPEQRYGWVAPPDSDSNHPVADLAEASAQAGFVPRLPPQELLEGEPFLRVLNSEGTDLTIRVADITARLQRVGISPADVQVPAEWDGVVIHFGGGHSVLAIYDGGNSLHRVMLVQGPLHGGSGILVPAGFPLDQWFEIMLRTVGLNAMEARAQRNRFAANPFGVMLLPPDYKGIVRQVVLKSGPAVLVENNGDDRNCAGCPYPLELALDWYTHDRFYGLRAAGLTQERAIEIADSLN